MSNLDPEKWQILQAVDLGRSVVTVAKSLERSEFCPHCAARQIQEYGMRKTRLTDLPIGSKRFIIVAQRQRWLCSQCGRTWPQPLSEVDEQHRLFRRVVDFIRREALQRTHTSIARELGIDPKTVFNIATEWITELDKSHRLTAPAVLGIDEIRALGKRRCVISDLESGRVIEVGENCSRVLIQDRLLRLENAERVQLVSTLPWGAYRVAIGAALPRAQVMVEKTHIAGMANRCLGHYLKTFKMTVIPAERGRMKRDQLLLLAREKDLSPADLALRDSWLIHFPALERAYRLKEAFLTVCDSRDSQEAQSRYATWEASIPVELKRSFRLLTTAMQCWRKEVFAYFDFHARVKHPFGEFAARLIADVIKTGRGYSFQILRGKVLYGTPPGDLPSPR